VSAAKVVTRRAAIRRPREHDTGHHLIGVGFAFSCSCGEHGRNRATWAEARQDGREHAAEHVREGADAAGAA
jgi:hypothetical protein